MKNKDKTPGAKIRRVRKSGDVTTLQRKLWGAVLAAEDLLLAKDATFDDQVRAVHALVQAGSAYAKLLETTEIEARLTALEEAAEKRGMRRVA